MLTVFVSLISALCTVRLTLAVLFPGTGSAWSALVRLAIFVIVLPAVPVFTVAVIPNVADPGLATVPTVQIPVPGTYVPWLGALDTYVRPAGRRSVTTRFVAVFGPKFDAVTVYVML